MRALEAVLAIALMLGPSSSIAEERWSEYWACERNVLSNVDVVEPSIWNGAELIVQALCVEVAANLANDLVRERDMAVNQDFGAAIQSALYVITRETAIALYNQRLLRMGLEEN